MAATVLSHEVYVGSTPSVAITGGSKLVLALVYASNGDGSTVALCELNSVAGVLVGSNSGFAGGEESTCSVFWWLDPGVGSYTIEATMVNGTSNPVYDVYELNDASPPASVEFTGAGGSTNPITVSHPLADAVGEVVVAFGLSSDTSFSGTQTFSETSALLSNVEWGTSSTIIGGSGFRSSVVNNPEWYGFEMSSGVGGGFFDRGLSGSIVIPDYVPPTVRIDSVSNSTPQPGDSVILALTYASGSGMTLSSTAGAITVTAQDASSLTFTVPSPQSFGDQSLNFEVAVVLTINDGGDTDTIPIEIQAEDGYITGQVVVIDPDGIYADDVGLDVGDSVYATVTSGDVILDIPTGLYTLTVASTLDYALYDGNWSGFATETFEEPGAPPTPGSANIKIRLTIDLYIG